MTLPNWARAHGEPLFQARLRACPEDFRVTESLGWEPSGDGEHDLLYLQKTGANTEWVAEQLAAFAGVPARDVGYAGMKDRHAITRQWFSVPRWNSPDWGQWVIDGVEVCSVTRHARKLRRGVHRSNRFEIVLREFSPFDARALDERMAQIRTLGVPNYFGEQRFGRQGNNLRLADQWAGGKRLSRPKRSLAISTVRAYVFNQALAERVESNTWQHLLSGDKANLAGTASVFDVDTVDDTLRRRCLEQDIHPTIVLAGEGSGIAPSRWQSALDGARVEEGHRSLRLVPEDVDYSVEDATVTVRFVLPKGAFATAVLREFCHWV